MKAKREIKIAAALMGVMLGLGALSGWLNAQEQDYVTRKWQAAKIDGQWPYDEVRVDVVDTKSVCLYIARDDISGIAITSIPKSRLRPGDGCQ